MIEGTTQILLKRSGACREPATPIRQHANVHQTTQLCTYLNCITGLHIQRNGFPGKGFYEDLHACYVVNPAQTVHMWCYHAKSLNRVRQRTCNSAQVFFGSRVVLGKLVVTVWVDLVELTFYSAMVRSCAGNASLLNEPPPSAPS